MSCEHGTDGLVPGHRPVGFERRYDPHSHLIWERGDAVWVWDSQGRKYLDCISGNSSNNLGYDHPCAREGIERGLRLAGNVPGGESRIRIELEQLLAKSFASQASCLTKPFDSEDCGSRSIDEPLAVWLSTTGSRGVEVAWKIARANRPGALIHFDLGFHGRSLGASLVSDTVKSPIAMDWQTSANEPPIAIPFPRTTTMETLEESCQGSLQRFEQLLDREADRISAILVEPAIGARGYYFAPGHFFQSLSRLASRHGVTTICDEIQMGMGRLGGWSAAIKQGWTPDIWVVGKSLGGGVVPISAVVGKRSLMDRLEPGLESETYGASPMACSIAKSVIEFLLNSPTIEESLELHSQLRIKLSSWFGEEAVVGAGSATAIDFSAIDFSIERLHSQRFETKRVGSANDPSEENAGNKRARNFVVEARNFGVLLHLTGPQRDRVAIIPPLTMNASQYCELELALERAWKSLVSGDGLLSG